MHRKSMEFIVGLFLIAGVCALLMLALNVSGLSTQLSGDGFEVTAMFDNIGDLKVRAPVTVAGVRVGQVNQIVLDPKAYKAIVKLKLERNATIPQDSSASIYTQGLLGSNYISLSPGYDTTFLHNGSEITSTHSALVLENLIGQLLFSLKNPDKK